MLYIGGGVPKNFIHQTEAMMGDYSGDHSYAIQYTTDAPHWGGLSGCTFEEAVSWGKVKREASKVQALRASGKRRKSMPSSIGRKAGSS